MPAKKLCASCVYGNPGYSMVSLNAAMSEYGIKNMKKHLSWLPTIAGKSVREMVSLAAPEPGSYRRNTPLVQLEALWSVAELHGKSIPRDGDHPTAYKKNRYYGESEPSVGVLKIGYVARLLVNLSSVSIDSRNGKRYKEMTCAQCTDAASGVYGVSRTGMEEILHAKTCYGPTVS